MHMCLMILHCEICETSVCQRILPGMQATADHKKKAGYSFSVGQIKLLKFICLGSHNRYAILDGLKHVDLQSMEKHRHLALSLKLAVKVLSGRKGHCCTARE